MANSWAHSDSNSLFYTGLPTYSPFFTAFQAFSNWVKAQGSCEEGSLHTLVMTWKRRYSSPPEPRFQLKTTGFWKAEQQFRAWNSKYVSTILKKKDSFLLIYEKGKVNIWYSLAHKGPWDIPAQAKKQSRNDCDCTHRDASYYQVAISCTTHSNTDLSHYLSLLSSHNAKKNVLLIF